MLEEYKKRPQDFTREIIANGTYKDMCKFETTLLKAFDVVKNPSFYNRHTNNGVFVNRKCLPSTREKISNALKGNKNSAGERPKFAGVNNPFYGKTHSDEFKAAQSSRKKKAYVGGGNPNARPIEINNVIYFTMKDATESLGISNYVIRKLLKEGKARSLK